ncbi:MAG: hypothetical protein A2Y34_00610 [Spirochaetes bacterium GWC1_27_15]|nr:MAG: hypothetical protein A2Z98_14525 [Spirochaetes bacterium GWB1_27_13]OHD21907.1 MAG: hypothetical protein A2Y34_00610 [Spirochaetes bacterium GWC1_27_15]
MKKALFFLISILILASCKNTDKISNEKGIIYKENIQIENIPSTLKKDWWKEAIFYECFVRSFKDTNGDGNGDIKGLIQKLDYLKNLGITGLWLMPMSESHFNADGYDVIDYRAIEKDYGTMDDFKNLLNEAHKRNIGVIIDFVPNHSSLFHPFFENSASSKNSEYRNWYCWKDKDPNWVHPWTKNGKTWHKTDNGYYYGVFYPFLPDFNYKNPSVLAYMKDNLKFWLNTGIDGFRFDAVHTLIENDSEHQLNQPETHKVYQDFRENIFNKYPNIYTVCEAPFTGDSFLGNGTNEFNSTFRFEYNKYVIQGLKNETPRSIGKAVEQAIQSPSGSYFATLLSNHDPFAGLRPFTEFNKNETKCKLAASILFTSPGIPFIYYGEEIGMDTIDLSQVPYPDAQIRTPMQWDSTLNAGFTTGKPLRNINPNYTLYNVELEEKNPNSILNHYKKMIAIRNNNKSLSLGNYENIGVSDKNKVFAFMRKYNNEAIIVVFNVTKDNANITLDFSKTTLPNKAITPKNDLFDQNISYGEINSSNFSIYSLNIEPYSFKIMKLEL